MIAWLCRHIFRGAGILLALGMITIFLLSVASEKRTHPGMGQEPHRPAAQARARH